MGGIGSIVTVIGSSGDVGICRVHSFGFAFVSWDSVSDARIVPPGVNPSRLPSVGWKMPLPWDNCGRVNQPERVVVVTVVVVMVAKKNIKLSIYIVTGITR